jgi:Protein of unknown function (DUF3617)
MPTPSRMLLAVTIALMVAPPVICETRIDEAALPAGSYAITTRLELPHVERWAIDKTTTICLSGHAASGQVPIPILSANNPYATCAAANLVIDRGKLEYDVLCPGRDAAKAHATYLLGAGHFTGRVAMRMGGKNMTMTEVQRAQRIGDCGSPRRETTTEF